MKTNSPKSFRATLEPSGMGLKSSFALLPFDVSKAWPGMQGRQVKGEINGFSFSTSLFPTPRGHGFIVNKKMLAGARARQGDRVAIRLEPDVQRPKNYLTEELAAAMRGAVGLRKWFEKLPPGHQRWIAHNITEPKSAASRQKRAQDMAERLYLTMEGEKEPPPILRLAFQRQPLAEKGWKALTTVQRRNHLFLIFGCRSAEARQKRVEAAIDAALEKSGRAGSARNNMPPDWGDEDCEP